ncbi:MAG: hypothetical protein AAFO58_02535 [Pseudomonadota bacterium]
MQVDPDLWLLIGLVIAVLCVPSMMSTWAQLRTPRTSAVTALIAIAMIGVAVWQKPGGYSWATLPDTLVETVGRYVN